MDMHKNARLTPHCRGLLVRRVVQGRALQTVAQELGISLPTVRKWVRRYRAEGEQDCRIAPADHSAAHRRRYASCSWP